MNGFVSGKFSICGTHVTKWCTHTQMTRVQLINEYGTECERICMFEVFGSSVFVLSSRPLLFWTRGEQHDTCGLYTVYSMIAIIAFYDQGVDGVIEFKFHSPIR